METLTLEECQTVLKKLQEICICNVCHGPLRSPDIMVCINGHATCSFCKIQTTSCALCKKGFCQNKPTTLCQMVEVMPRFCRFNYGCNQILQDNDDHESWCKFRHVKCPFCSSGVECHTLIKHFGLSHNQKPHIMSSIDFQKKCFQIDLQFGLNVGVLKQLNGNLFFIRYLYYLQEKCLKVLVEFWPMEKVVMTAFKFNLEICSTDNKVSFTYCQELTIAANVKNVIFSIADPILKSYQGKDVNFKTVVSDLHGRKSFSPSPAKKSKNQ